MRFSRGTLALALTGACASPALAQSFGQWWWEGRVDLRQRNHTQESGGAESDSRQQELRLFSAVNGFLYHPAIGDFRLELDVSLQRVDNGKSANTDRTGFGTTVNLLPRGAYPLSVYAGRRSYEHGGPLASDPLGSLRLPDTLTNWGARFKTRRGAFRGFLVGFDRQETDFVSADTGQELSYSRFVDFSRRGNRFDHRIRVEQRLRDLETTGVSTEDTVVTVDESAELTDRWRWALAGDGYLRDLESTSGPDFSRADKRLRNRFVFTRDARNLLDFQITANRLEGDAAPTIEGWGASAFYRRRVGRGWEVAPRAAYDRRTADDMSLDAPQVGIAVSRAGAIRTLDTVFSANANHGLVKVEEPGESREETQTALAFSGTLGHGEAESLRKELEVEWSRNQLDLVRQPLPGLPDLGLAGSALETHDRQRARIRLAHAWDSRSIGGSAEWSRLATSRSADENLELDTILTTLQWNTAAWKLDATLGDTRSNRTVVEDQAVLFYGARANWRARSYLTIHGSYHASRRQLDVTPDTESTWTDLAATLHVGLLDLELHAFYNTDSFDGEPDQKRQGLRWSISRRFAGWLPIVTGTERRGVIR